MAPSFVARLGIEHPLIQAPMSGSTTPALVAAVSNAGALGSLGAGYLEPQAILDQADEVRTLSDKPFGLNLFVLPESFEVDMAAVDAARRALDALMEREGLAVRTAIPARWAPSFHDQFAALCEARPAVASFAFDLITSAQVRQLKQLGIVVVGTATTVAEARAWEALGADAVSLQSAEAGGHRGTFLHDAEDGMIGLFALLPLAVRAMTALVRDVPVIAAGGIMDGRGMLAAEVLGAAASQLGTAFLACPECGAAAGWKRDLPQSAEQDVTTIRSFSGRAARGLRNTYVKAMADISASLPAYPVTNALTSPLRKAAVAAGRPDLTNEWCGQGAGLSRTMPAGELVAVLMDEYAQARRAFAFD